MKEKIIVEACESIKDFMIYFCFKFKFYVIFFVIIVSSRPYIPISLKIEVLFLLRVITFKYLNKGIIPSKTVLSNDCNLLKFD